MLPPHVPIFYTARRICHVISGLAVVTAVVTTVMLAQPLQEQVFGSRVQVPAISERIDIRPIDDQIGSFAGLKSTASTRIYGVVINEVGVVLPSAGIIVIRSLMSGHPVAQTEVDTLGQFAIRGIDSGLYTAELVSSSGKVLTSSPAFTVGVGEVVQLTPVVPQRGFDGLSQLFTSGTTAALISAVSAGVLTVAPLPSVSPE
jgi:hypothetical protein